MITTMLALATCLSEPQTAGRQGRFDLHGHPHAVLDRLGHGTDLAWERMARLLAPQGSIVVRNTIPQSVARDGYDVMGRVFKHGPLLEFSRLQWNGVTNAELADEQLVTSWKSGDTTVMWADVDRTQAVLTVSYPRPTIPTNDPNAVASFVEAWLTANLQMPDPMPAEMKLFQAKHLDAEKQFLIGSVAFSDEVSNELLQSLDPQRKWCRNFRIVATPERFSLVVAINWITTGGPQAPPSPVKDGRRVSRFTSGIDRT